MNRQQYENLFFKIKPLVYDLTNSHPELAHHLFINNLNFIARNLDIEKILGFEGLEKIPNVGLAPAAGFNKNGNFNPDGGIRDIQTAEERITENIKAIKIYTAMVYQGPKIVRELRTYLNGR
jgi:hypothetical protein